MSSRRRILPRASLFDERPDQAWIVARTPWRSLIEYKKLPPNSDLLRAFIVELLRYHDEGWRLGEFSAYLGNFFCTKEGEHKREVYITLEDPTRPEKPQGGYFPGTAQGCQVDSWRSDLIKKP